MVRKLKLASWFATAQKLVLKTKMTADFECLQTKATSKQRYTVGLSMCIQY